MARRHHVVSYPKTYAVFWEKRPREWHHSYTERDYVYVFRIVRGPDAGTDLVLDRYPSRSGWTPDTVKRKFAAVRWQRPRPKQSVIDAQILALQRETVLKLYRRGRQWYYRCVGS